LDILIKHRGRGGALILAGLVFCGAVYADVEIPDQKAARAVSPKTEAPKIIIEEKSSAESPPPATIKPLKKKPAVSDKIISATFKSLARGFVAVVDLDRLKKDDIALINKMRPDKFQKQYAKVYAVLKDMPEQMRQEYKISADMSREQIIKNIESLDKPKMYAVVDAIPDALIADTFRQYLEQSKEEIQKSNAAGQIQRLWNQWMEKAHGK
jgi:hypothetical protein